MLYFRIEDENSWSDNPQLRDYSNTLNEDWNRWINVEKADSYIAQKIREEVNGWKNRTLFSFTRSLAVALFKYNKWIENPLIILFSDIPENYIKYIDENGAINEFYYSISSHLKDFPLLCHLKTQTQNIKICNFCLAIDNNQLLDSYLYRYTKKHKKVMASPEKDEEVIMLIAPERKYIISKTIPELYIIYTLHLQTGFLYDEDICTELKEKIIQYALDDRIDVMNDYEACSLCLIIDFLNRVNIYNERTHPAILSAIKNPQMHEDEYNIALDILRNDIYIPSKTNLEYDIGLLYEKYLNKRFPIF